MLHFRLPPLRPDDPLGRGIHQGNQFKKAKNQGTIVFTVFLERGGINLISVDRLDHAPDDAMAKIGDAIAAGRGSHRSFYGWAVNSVRDASRMNRQVIPLPLLDNQYHANIRLPLPDGAERRDAQIEHAVDLAKHATYRARSPI